jgi:hypothetical protein
VAIIQAQNKWLLNPVEFIDEADGHDKRESGVGPQQLIDMERIIANSAL